MQLKSITKAVLIAAIPILFWSGKRHKVGDILLIYNSTPVYYNGKVSNVQGRNYSPNGYNFGLKWQCVEFVKRYYHNILGHKMPDTYGHAKEFFDDKLGDASFNPRRGLHQFKNTRKVAPKVNDILVFGATPDNPFGHIAIISKVEKDAVQIIQQNVGISCKTSIPLFEYRGIFTVGNPYVKGWLRI